MIKKILHISDLHFRTYKRHDEYRMVMSRFLEEAKALLTEYTSEEIRIVITGDIVHQKITISNELTMLVAWFLRECADICKVVLIAGNHDLLENNQDRMDSITPITELMDNPNISYLKESICVEDNNIIWVVYSIFNTNTAPEALAIVRGENPDKTFIGLFHAPIIGSKTALGYEFADSGVSPDYFEHCDIVLLGDIHKRQEFTNKFGTKMAFPSSLIQQDFGETVSGHGYLFWDIETRTYSEHNLYNEAGFYQFKITSITDLDTESEELMNF